jgi:hypothetical protein
MRYELTDSQAPSLRRGRLLLALYFAERRNRRQGEQLRATGSYSPTLAEYSASVTGSIQVV